MSEELRRTQNEANVVVPKHRALETMEELGYNPVKELIQLAQELKNEEFRDFKTEVGVHKELMKHYSAVPRSVDVNVSGKHAHNFTMIKPATYMETNTEEDPAIFEQCNPEVIDITGGYLTGDKDDDA